jgi:hypothetical protein
MPMPMSMSMSMSKMSSPNNLGHQNCWSQAPESRDGRWIKAQKLCDSFYPSRSAFEAVPLTRNRSDGINVPTVFSEREAIIARIVLNSNRDEGEEYVEKLKDSDFVYHSRKEVRWGLFARQCVCILRSCFLFRLFLRCSLFMKYIFFLSAVHAASGDLGRVDFVTLQVLQHHAIAERICGQGATWEHQRRVATDRRGNMYSAHCLGCGFPVREH